MALTSTTTKHNSPATSHRPAPALSGSLSPAISHSCALFCTFLHSPKTQLFSFQSFPHSLPKTPGVGYLLPLYEDKNETANCQSRRAIRSLQPPRPQGSSMPCPGSGPALWSLSAPSRRAATRASRRSFPAPDHKVPVFSNCTGHQLFPHEPLPASGTKPHLPPPKPRPKTVTPRDENPDFDDGEEEDAADPDPADDADTDSETEIEAE